MEAAADAWWLCGACRFCNTCIPRVPVPSMPATPRLRTLLLLALLDHFLGVLHDTLRVAQPVAVQRALHVERVQRVLQPGAAPKGWASSAATASKQPRIQAVRCSQAQRWGFGQGFPTGSGETSFGVPGPVPHLIDVHARHCIIRAAAAGHCAAAGGKPVDGAAAGVGSGQRASIDRRDL